MAALFYIVGGIITAVKALDAAWQIVKRLPAAFGG